jgi:F0F1-type ATP synthase membrane subunit b/b'
LNGRGLIGLAEKPVVVNLLKASAGITENAAVVYKHILIVGSLTVGEVCQYTGLELGVVSKVLEELVNARLIRKLSHVVDRYVAVAPYRAFAEHLVEFQRTIKEVEENAEKSIDLSLAEISKATEQFKASANKLREEEVSRVKQETNQLKDEAETARKGLVEKLAQDTEAKKSNITETLKKHVDDHSQRIQEFREDATLRLDNSAAKFSETTAKLKEEASQSTLSYLNRFEERIQAFVGSVSDRLTAFQSEFYAFAENYEKEASSFLEDFNAKAGELANTIKQKANDIMREVGQSLAQLSMDLERTVTNEVDAEISRSSSSNAGLESSIKGVFQANGEKLSQTISAFQTEVQAVMNGWRSTSKDDLKNWFSSLKETAASNLQNVFQKLESTKAPMSEILRNYMTSAEGSSDELNSSMNTLVESIKKDLADGISSTREELQESVDKAMKDCNSLVATLESLSKKSIPLTSKTLTDFNSDITSKLTKMFTADIENVQSFSEEVKQKVLKLVPTVTPAPASGERAKKTGAGQDDLRKEISDKIDDISSSYIEAAKKSIDTSEKYAFTKISNTMKFEEELEKKWGSITSTIAKVSELTEAIESFPRSLEKVISESTSQYGKKVESTSTSTRRLLNVHSKKLEDGITNNLKKWGTAIEKTMKEFSDITIKRQHELDDAITNQTNVMETVTTDKAKELADVVSKQIEALSSEIHSAQNLTASHIALNTQNIEEQLKNVMNNLKQALEATLKSFNASVESKCKENDDMIANAINETSRTVTEMKERVSSSIKSEKDQLGQICEGAIAEFGQIASEYTKQLGDIASSLTNSFIVTVNDANERYKKETETTKTALIDLLTQHIRNYTEAVNKITVELNSTLDKHFEDCSALAQHFGTSLNELLNQHQNKYETASNRMVKGLATTIDQDEAALRSSSNKMLKEFSDNTTSVSKEANSTESLMRAAWAEITDTQQINTDKTWHYVTKRAVLEHVRDMVKRTKSTVTIVVPSIEEAALREVKEISRAIRIQIISGVDEKLHAKLLKELFMQGNVRIWSLTEKDYISCTRDAEEVLIAPVARKDIDCVATVSVEENYVKLYHKFIGPMWMASSREIKEKTLG